MTFKTRTMRCSSGRKLSAFESSSSGRVAGTSCVRFRATCAEVHQRKALSPIFVVAGGDWQHFVASWKYWLQDFLYYWVHVCGELVLQKDHEQYLPLLGECNSIELRLHTAFFQIDRTGLRTRHGYRRWVVWQVLVARNTSKFLGPANKGFWRPWFCLFQWTVIATPHKIAYY